MICLYDLFSRPLFSGQSGEYVLYLFHMTLGVILGMGSVAADSILFVVCAAMVPILTAAGFGSRAHVRKMCDMDNLKEGLWCVK